MFPTGKKFRFFAIFLMMAAAVLVGCDGGDGGNNGDDNEDGALDNGFGANGVLVVEAQGQEIPSVEQAAKNQDLQVRNQQKQRERLFINRLSENNLRKGTFRALGDDIIEAVAVDDVNDVVAYAGISDGAVTKVLFAKSNRDGVLDDAFGGDGRVAIDVGAAAVGNVEINDVVIEGTSFIAIGTFVDGGGDRSVIAVKVDNTGVVDAAFGTDGVAEFDNLQGAADDEGNGAVLSGGQVFIARTAGAVTQAGALVIDAITGAQVADFIIDADGATGLDLALDSGGNIIVVGARADGSQVVKMDAAGALDGNFGGGDGIVDVGDANFQTVLIDADDNIVIAGRDIATTDTFLTRRLGADGEIDPVFNGGANLVFEPKIGAENQFAEDVFLRDTDIILVGGAAAAGDILGFISILDATGNQLTNFETEGLVSADNINEDLRQGVVDGATNRIIAVGVALEADNAGFDGVAVRIDD